MTPEEAKNLKVGDRVVVSFNRGFYIPTEVKKISPTGQITVADGRRFKSNRSEVIEVTSSTLRHRLLSVEQAEKERIECEREGQKTRDIVFLQDFRWRYKLNAEQIAQVRALVESFIQPTEGGQS